MNQAVIDRILTQNARVETLEETIVLIRNRISELEDSREEYINTDNPATTIARSVEKACFNSKISGLREALIICLEQIQFILKSNQPQRNDHE